MNHFLAIALSLLSLTSCALCADREVSIPLDQFTDVFPVGRQTVRLAVHDNGSEHFQVSFNHASPLTFTKADGFDTKGNNVTLIFVNSSARIYYVNTPRASAGCCILRVSSD
jgi:hypothetical protein